MLPSIERIIYILTLEYHILIIYWHWQSKSKASSSCYILFKCSN